MRFVFFCHSVLSDWNHGNAHFLRGMAVELESRGHVVHIFEPVDSWSATNLAADQGQAALDATRLVYPGLRVTRYGPSLDLRAALEGADVVLVHEWNAPELVRRIGAHAPSRRRFVLLFHDTHHRSVTDPSMSSYDLSGFDGVLAFGETIRRRYLASGWAARAWTWHEAADVRVFRPIPALRCERDIVWIGNWGDGERTAELEEFLLGPVRRLGLSGTVYGVRYPAAAIEAVREAGLEYRGWLPNYRVPEVFARHRVTVHVPRRPYVTALPGIPTIRPFEALACGIPLVSAPWCDSEGLFGAGVDYRSARDGDEMTAHLTAVLSDPDGAARMAAAGRQTILARHTCAHRADELLAIVADLRQARRAAAGASPPGHADEAASMGAPG